MSDIRSQPCSACPYRRDCPSGLWEAHEYDKLRDYDNITPDQPWAPFMCHATPEHLCHGWAVVHTSRGHEFDLLSLRMTGYPEIPAESVPLFASGNEAADWGQRDIESPSTETLETIDRLVRKYPGLPMTDEPITPDMPLEPFTDAEIVSYARGVITQEYMLADARDRDWEMSLMLMLSGMASNGGFPPNASTLFLVPMGPHQNMLWLNGRVPGMTVSAVMVPLESVDALIAKCDEFYAFLHQET